MLQIVDDGRIRALTLDRPEALNAFNNELYFATGDALIEAAERPDIACVVITGRGRAFCAGQDLGEMAQLGDGATPPADARAANGFSHFTDTLAAFPKPVLAAVNGLGVGIGMTMLLHTDINLIAAGARLRAPFVPLGVVPEAAGSLLMPVVMGNQRAALALYRGAWITAEDAVECGLALRVVPAEDLLTETMNIAREIAAMPVASLMATKRLVVEARIDAVRAARAREDAMFAQMIGGPANMEAIAAFLAKRDPDFSSL